MMTILLQKHWECQEERTPMLRHGSVVRPTMYLASMEIKTATDEARPRHVAKIVEDHNTHGWLISALLREMSGLEGQAMFECVESKFSFHRCLRQGSVEAPRFWQKMAKRGRKLGKNKNGRSFRCGRTKNTPDMQLHVGRQLLDHVPLTNSSGTDVAGSHSGRREVGLGPKLASPWWARSYDPEEKIDLSIDTKSGRHRFPSEESSIFKDAL